MDEDARMREIHGKERGIENQLALNSEALLNDQFNYKALLSSGREFFQAKFIDLREAYKTEHDEANAKYEQELTDLKAAFDAKKLTQEEYANKVIETNGKIADNNQQQFDRNRQLDQLEIQAKKETAAATVQVAENLVGLLNALGAFSTDWQIAAALADAILGIAKIVIATQTAIAEFSASVAWMGPVGVPIATAYAVKQKIQAGLGIAAITVGAIGKINSIKGNSGAASASNSNQPKGMGKNYGDGGMIDGPRHAGGGVMINAEGGEAVMTRGAVTMFRPLLSMMNQAGGGTSFNRGATGQANYDNPKTINGPTDPQIIKTYVVENELTSHQHRVARLKDLSTL